jgi:enolase
LDPNTERYDIDGPKNLYDTKMLITWYQKLLNDHPLVTYLEDAVRVGDVAGWQQLCSTLKESH